MDDKGWYQEHITEAVDEFVRGVWSKTFSPRSLPRRYFERVRDFLTSAVLKGYGRTETAVDWTQPDVLMVRDLTQSVAYFAAGKTHQQAKALTELLTVDGRARTLQEFMKVARPLMREYNGAWMEAEFIATTSASRSASQWVTIEANAQLMPLLRYDTAHDSRVRPAHKLLEGICRPWDDPFWDVWFTPNGWRCRCDVTQHLLGIDITQLRDRELPSEEEAPEIFRFNPGKKRAVFSEKHPYFEVEKRDKRFAKGGFGLVN